MRSSSTTRLASPAGPGSVSGAPNLPAGFTGTFKSVYVNIGELTLHAVIGGDGPPLLLVHGWPETWYAWRLLMPAPLPGPARGLRRHEGALRSTAAAAADGCSITLGCEFRVA
jgi:hypothetical protein